LFLIRHLLILREQLSPFDVKLQSHHHEKKLDFRPTSIATKYFTSSLTSSAGQLQLQSLIRLDGSNSIYQWARDGLPAVEDYVLDMKAEIDQLLKNTCYAFKNNSMKILLGSLEGLVMKINAFLDDPLANSSSAQSSSESSYLGTEVEESQFIPISNETKQLLKQQAFMKIDRMKEIFLQVQESVVHILPDYRDHLKVRKL
jgi:hypothetical protein